MSGTRVLIPYESVDTPPVVKIVQTPMMYKVRPAPGAGPAYQTSTITNGYGRSAGVSVTLQLGFSVDLDVDLTVNAISYERFDEWHTQTLQAYSSYDWHYLNEHYDASAEAGGWFGGFFGGASASGDYNHYKNSSDQFQSNSSQQSDGIVKSIYNLDNDVLHVTGKVRGTGVSYYPVTATVWLQVTKIVFADGKTLTAIDTKNPIVATPEGDTTGASTTPTKLTAVKI